jgi:hypothetical protein
MQPIESTNSLVLKTRGKHMPRQRHQTGSVEKTDTKPQRWNGRYAV